MATRFVVHIRHPRTDALVRSMPGFHSERGARRWATDRGYLADVGVKVIVEPYDHETGPAVQRGERCPSCGRTAWVTAAGRFEEHGTGSDWAPVCIGSGTQAPSASYSEVAGA